MTLKKRLKKIEDSVGEKKDFAPTIVILNEGDDEETILLRLKDKYGESYEPRIIIRRMRPVIINGKELEFDVGTKIESNRKENDEL